MKGRYAELSAGRTNRVYIIVHVQVTACVLWQGRKLGFTCYDADNSYLHCMSDVVETEDFGYLSRGLWIA